MDIEFDKCTELLSKDLHMLGLENNPIYGKSSVHDILLETYGCKKGIELYGWWTGKTNSNHRPIGESRLEEKDNTKAG